MKNNFLKYASLFLFSAVLLTGCEEDKVIFDGSSKEAVVAFNKGGDNLGVPESGVGELIVQVDVTSVSSMDRAIEVEIDPASTAVAEEYSIDAATLVIPANSYNGTIKITGNFDALPSGSTKTLILNLVSVEGASVDTQKTVFVVSLFRVCPVEATFMVGNYLFEEMTDYVDGPTLEDGVVLSVTGPLTGESSFTRHFQSLNFPNYCTVKNDFTFSLVCGEVTIPATDNTSNCTCAATPPFIFGPPTENGTYDFDDDSVVYIAFTNDVNANCSPAAQTVYRLTKQ